VTKPKKIALLVVLGLFLYLSLYTWNLRTGYLDDLSSRTGLDIAGWVVRPGQWVTSQAVETWERYVYLVGLREENDLLKERVRQLRLEKLKLRERARTASRLETMLGFVAPPDWKASGARVVMHRLGPTAALDTVAIDKGTLNQVFDGQPVACLDGVVGRVLKAGFSNAQVLLLTDPNSRIAVQGDLHRSQGVLVGRGENEPLEVRYMNLNSEIEAGEMLVTSGMAGIFPKGLPVARVTDVRRSDISLFLTIIAKPLVDPAGLEEVLLLTREAAAEEDHAEGE
jgi:rod shape-determining protein MreC